MSIDQPNEYEQSIEEYASSVRLENDMKKALDDATGDYQRACAERQEEWRKVRVFINQGFIKPGIYRLRKGPGLYAEGILINKDHDYPELFPMFR